MVQTEKIKEGGDGNRSSGAGMKIAIGMEND